MNFPNTLFTLLFLSLWSALSAQETGIASYYSDNLHGKKTASGEVYDKNLYTAAHRILPFGAMAQVTNLSNNLSVIVKINDMGPNNPDRLIDLSRAAATSLGMIQSGTAKVRVTVINEYPDEKPSDVKPGPVNGAVVIPAPPSGASVGASAPAIQVAPPPPSYELYLPNVKPGHVDTETYQKNKASASNPAVGTRSLGNDPQASANDINQLYPLSKQGYGVQVGAYSNYNYMTEMTRTLFLAGFSEIMIQNNVPGDGVKYKVIMGPFEGETQAKAYQEKLASKNIKGHLVNLQDL